MESNDIILTAIETNIFYIKVDNWVLIDSNKGFA